MATAPPIRPKRRPRRLWGKPKPDLTIAQILGWADAFHKRRGRWRDLTPLGRIGRSEDVADAVLFLLSEQSSFINGQTLVVCGGRVMLP